MPDKRILAVLHDAARRHQTPTELLDAVLSRMRPSVRLVPSPSRPEVGPPLGACRIGGRPDLPIGVAWPRLSTAWQVDPRDSGTVWLDLEEKGLQQRWKLFRSHNEKGRFGQSVYSSPAGIRWGDRVVRTGSTGDRTTAFYNPFRKVWVYSLRHGWGVPRRRRYWETRPGARAGLAGHRPTALVGRRRLPRPAAQGPGRHAAAVQS